ncbi:MAG TPA: hypothetical protein VN715_06215 [Roseiarcus sp.]|nr:hypothetical protein [Roseiarcus sp.]
MKKTMGIPAALAAFTSPVQRPGCADVVAMPSALAAMAELNASFCAAMLAHSVRCDGEARGIRRSPPSVGQHTEEVLREAGFSAENVAAMREAGAVGPDRAVTSFDRKASAPVSSYSRKVKTTR